MKKNIVITKGQLQKIIKEGVSRLHKQNLIENRIKEINEELNLLGFDSEDLNSPKQINITIQVRGRWQEVITILPEEPIEDGYYEVYHRFNNGKETRVNGGFFGIEDAEDWVNNSYLPNYNSHEIIDVETKNYESELSEWSGDAIQEGDTMGKEEYEILEAYLEAALWTEEEEIGPASISDVSDESREAANQDVFTFMSQAGPLLDGIDPSQVGYDLWLTRNGHGAGFWDRGLGEVGDQLSEIAKSMGSKYVYRGDDDKIYIE